MNTYRPKKLIEGRKLKPEFAGKDYIAVPEKKLPCQVIFNNLTMHIEENTPFVMINRFRDQFKRDEFYYLRYYEWKPENPTLFTL